MNAPVHLILIVLACVLFFLAGLGGPWQGADAWPYRGRLVAWGLFCWCVSTLVTS
jgi:hypothetical protein